MVQAREVFIAIDKLCRKGIKNGCLPKNPSQERIKRFLDYHLGDK